MRSVAWLSFAPMHQRLIEYIQIIIDYSDSSGGNAAHFAVLSGQHAVVAQVVSHSPRYAYGSIGSYRVCF